MYRGLSCLLAALALASGSAQAEVKIGFANPLSGDYALSGGRNRVAVELAVRHLNDAGGVLGEPVTLLAVDDACGLERAVEAAQELVAAGAVMVVGHWCSHSSLLAAGVYETADVLMISPSSTHPRLTEEGRRNVFRLNGRDDQQGRLAGDFLARNWPGEAIAILHDGSTYGEGLASQTRRSLRAHGVRAALYDVYQPGELDHAALATRLEAAAIEVLYIGGYGPDAARILRAVRARGDDLQLVGGDGLGMEEFRTIAGPIAEGTVFSARPLPAASLPVAAELLTEFRVRGLGTRSGSIAAYAVVEAWSQAAERAGSVELPAVADMLRRGRFATVLGPIAFDGKGDLAGASWQWQRWSGGSTFPLREPGPSATSAAADRAGPLAIR
jgi:branched-chain amino acid transport system substrate-binding protein